MCALLAVFNTLLSSSAVTFSGPLKVAHLILQSVLLLLSQIIRSKYVCWYICPNMCPYVCLKYLISWKPFLKFVTRLPIHILLFFSNTILEAKLKLYKCDCFLSSHTHALYYVFNFIFWRKFARQTFNLNHTHTVCHTNRQACLHPFVIYATVTFPLTVYK